MRSLTDLQVLADKHNIPVLLTDEAGTRNKTREELMDDLREVTGDFDPTVQLDPAKAKDLKNEIDWTLPGVQRFEKVLAGKSKEWVLEPKLDGARLRIFLGKESNTMNSGRRSDVTFKYIERADNFPHLRDTVFESFAGTVLDGELMPPVTSLTTTSGVTTKGTLNSAMALLNVNPADSIKTQDKYGKAIFMAFDILMFKGESVMHLPLSQRRDMLTQILSLYNNAEPAFQFIAQYPAEPQHVQDFLEAGYEGAMLKRLAGPYLPGKRMSDWLKIKTMSTGDFVVIGSVPGKGRNEGKVGSMKVGYYKDETSVEATYCADVAGISDAFRDELTDPATGDIKDEYLGMVIEVMAQGVTKNGRLRHPHYVRTRPDKTPADCTADCSIDLFPEV